MSVHVDDPPVQFKFPVVKKVDTELQVNQAGVALCRPSTGVTRPVHGRESALLGLPVQMLMLPPNTLTDAPRVMLDQISEHPSRVTHKINRHTIKQGLPFPSLSSPKELLFHFLLL